MGSKWWKIKEKAKMRGGTCLLKRERPDPQRRDWVARGGFRLGARGQNPGDSKRGGNNEHPDRSKKTVR